jgi:hypothetical protein
MPSFWRRLGLGHHAAASCASGGYWQMPASVPAGKRADRIEGHVAPQLEPDLGANILQHRRLQSAADEALRHAPDPLALGAVRLADRKAIAFDVLDDARPDQLGRRIDDAADDALAGMCCPMSPSDRHCSPAPRQGARDARENTSTGCRSASAPRRYADRTASAPRRPPPRPGAPSWPGSRCPAGRRRRNRPWPAPSARPPQSRPAAPAGCPAHLVPPDSFLWL